MAQVRAGVSPTGYVIADGNDLAEVFLGKEETAKAAEIANTTTAIMNGLNFSSEPVVTVTKTVSGSSTINVTFDINGMVIGTDSNSEGLGSIFVRINGLTQDMEVDKARFLVYPGFTVQVSNTTRNATLTGTFYIQPIKVIASMEDSNE